MIKDAVALREIQMQWAGVISLRDKIQRSLFAGSGLFGRYPIFAADSAHNLPFLHASSVFNEALIVARDEGKFKCKSIFLGALVGAADLNLSWAD